MKKFEPEEIFITNLFEPGLNLIFGKTTKPVGIRFRKFIFDLFQKNIRKILADLFLDVIL